MSGSGAAWSLDGILKPVVEVAAGGSWASKPLGLETGSSQALTAGKMLQTALSSGAPGTEHCLPCLLGSLEKQMPRWNQSSEQLMREMGGWQSRVAPAAGQRERRGTCRLQCSAGSGQGWQASSSQKHMDRSTSLGNRSISGALKGRHWVESAGGL